MTTVWYRNSKGNVVGIECEMEVARQIWDALAIGMDIEMVSARP